MTRHTSRRHLLRGAAMLTAVPVAALGGVPMFDVIVDPMPLPQGDTPILALYRRWRAYRDWLNSPTTRGMPEEEYEALVDWLDPMEAEMDRLPAQTMTDLAAKVLCLSGAGEGAIPDGAAFFAECEALMAQIGTGEGRQL